MVFSDIAHKAFHSLSPNSYAADTTIIAPDGLTLEMVLLDQTISPFSLQDFSEYLKLTYCNENLLFYEAVTEYKNRCASYFGVNIEDSTTITTISKPKPVTLSDDRSFDFSTLDRHVLTPREQIWFDTLKYKFEIILKEFILSDAPHEINIPYEIRHQLLQSYQTQQLYHPALLYPACNAVVELLRISAFIPFATDPSRLYCPMKKKHAIRKQKSTPILSASLETNCTPPPLPNIPSPLPTEITTSTSMSFLKKITTTFRFRYSTSNNEENNVQQQQSLPSPPLPPTLPPTSTPLQNSKSTGWRHINIPFKSASTALPPSSPSAHIESSSPLAVTPPSIIKSSTSTSSTNSSCTSSSSVESFSNQQQHHHHHSSFLKHLPSTANKKIAYSR